MSPNFKLFLETLTPAFFYTGDHVSLLQVKVVVWPEDVAGGDRGPLEPLLREVHVVHGVHHALGASVAVVALVGRTVMEL